MSIVGNSEKPEHHILMTGDELILECEVSGVNAIVQWYFNGHLLQEDSRTHIESRDTMRKLVISGLQTSDSGEYLCDAIDDKMITRLTVQGKFNSSIAKKTQFQTCQLKHCAYNHYFFFS